VLWVALTLVVLLAVAVTIIVAVALPHLRSGAQVLTPEGERLVREAKSRLTNTAPER
jgi:hypothetical protein